MMHSNPESDARRAQVGRPRGAFDVIVVGAGHAGVEAALASARMGCRTAMLTLDRTSIGRMSCNPAIGGLGKGHLVREIDALGGEMGRAIDRAGVQYRMLNTRKGPAVWGPRAQADRELYNQVMLDTVAREPNIEVLEGEAIEILVDRCVESRPLDRSSGTECPRVTGVRLADGNEIGGQAVILATGTFLGGKMFVGEETSVGGRRGEPAATQLTKSLVELGHQVARLKTGTPPRVLMGDLDMSRLERQPGDEIPRPFSHFDVESVANRPQLECFLTRTTHETHEIVRRHLHQSPLLSGDITGTGPRYCPSLEDKVKRFPDVEGHLLFLEPEGWDTDEVYVNGISMSLPEDAQAEVLCSIPGIREGTKPHRVGYAVEYDFVDPTQLRQSLESRKTGCLFLAGQINGTTGYEEAAAQGLVAGVNASLHIKGEKGFLLGRDEAYIGVLIDDLVTKGTDEPYRMFTSRAEYRLHLRQDNADERMLPHAERLGLLSSEDLDRLRERVSRVEELTKKLQGVREQGMSVFERLARPEESLSHWEHLDFLGDYSCEERERVAVRAKYRGYLARERSRIERHRGLEKVRIPETTDFSLIRGISHEGREKLGRIRPLTVGQASRISGVSPADISVLLVALKRRAG